MNYEILTSWIFLLMNILAGAQASCDEDGWLPFGDEKCFKILGDLVATRDAALELCEEEADSGSGSGSGEEIPTLLEIKSQHEQTFLTEKLFGEQKILDNIWLGAKRVNKTFFQWGAEDPVEYSSWGAGFPTQESSYGCSQLTSPVGKSSGGGGGGGGAMAGRGDWRDVPCGKRNVPVCQKQNTLSVGQLQKVVFNLVNNPVPQGFIYVQLPFHDKPEVLWPGVMWREVTEEYEGLFFRAAGGTSAPFGEIQEDSCNRLTSVEYETTPEGQGFTYPTEVTIPEEGWSTHLRAGYWYHINHNSAVRFQNSGEETRPRNTAVLIWERV